jgi:hypothetical protein
VNSNQFSGGFVQITGGFFGYVFVAGAVKPVGPDTQVGIEMVWNRVTKGFFRHGLVESRIEHRHLLRFGENPLRYLNTQVIGWVV